MSRSAGRHFMHKDLIIMSLLFLALMALYALNWDVGYGDSFGRVFGDVSVTAAERVQAGDIPYRDFWTMYAPGSFYLLALLFTLFGNHVLVGTVAASAMCAAAACVCYRTVANLTGTTWPALVCALVFFAATYSTVYYLSLGPYPPTILLVLLAVYFIVEYYRSGNISRLFAAGLATGAVIVFKHDVGAYTAIAITTGLLLAHVPRLRTDLDLPLPPVRELFLFSLAVALPSVPVALYFAVIAGPDMWRDLIVFPATDFRFTRGEHYPDLIPGNLHDDWWLKTVFKFMNYLKFTLPFLMFLAALVTMLVAVLKRQGRYVPVAAMFAVAYLFHYSSAHIQINTNVITLALYGILMGTMAFHYADSHLRPRGQTLLRVSGIAFSLVLFMSYFSEPFYSRLRDVQESVVLTLPKVSGLRVSPDMRDTLNLLVSFIDSHVPPEKKIFVGLHRHDTVVIGDGKMYFILDRRNATRQDQLHPGIVDTARIQREMIRDLQRNDVEYIVIRHVFDDKALDRLRENWKKTLPESGATELDSFIREHYQRLESSGQYEIWGRRER